MPPEWIKSKRRFRLLTARYPEDFRLADRLVYSFLAFRSRKGIAASCRRIAEETGLDRDTGVKSAMIRLRERGLVGETADGWIALEPIGGNFFFSLKNDSPHWSQRLGYIWYCPPAHTLTASASVLLWTLVNQDRSQNITGLSRLLGITRKTVLKHLVELEGLEIARRVRTAGHRFRVELNVPPDLFVDIETPRSPEWQKWEKWLIQDGVPAKLREPLLRDLLRTPNPPTTFLTAIEGHEQYLKSNPDGTRHIGYRLRIEIDKSFNLGQLS